MFDRPHVSRFEFKKVRQGLASMGFSLLERQRLEELFRGDLDETGDQEGIDKTELERGLQWLRQHTSEHHFSSHQIDEIEAELRKYL